MRVLVLTAMYPSKENPTLGTFVKQSVDSLIAAGVDVEVMPFDGAGSLKNYVKTGLALRKKLEQGNYDLVQAHYGLTGIPARMQFKVPVVVTYHGSDLLGEVGPDGRYTMIGRIKVLLGQLVGLMVNRRTVVAPVLKKKIWHRQAEIIPMGVDMLGFRPTDQAEARAKLGLSQDRKIVLFLANPKNGVKRFDVARQGVELLNKKMPDVELLPVFQANHEQVPQYLNAADVLVLTSNHEASPCVIKEALACNLSIVSVDVGDVAERIEDVGGSYLCERTPEDVAAKLEAALKFEGPVNGREKVEEISLERTAALTLGVFKEALAGR